MTTRSALSVKNATKRFGGLIAVSGMSFEIAEHEVLGLIGPNGSGKNDDDESDFRRPVHQLRSYSTVWSKYLRPFRPFYFTAGSCADFPAGAHAQFNDGAAKCRSRWRFRSSTALGAVSAIPGRRDVGKKWE